MVFSKGFFPKCTFPKHIFLNALFLKKILANLTYNAQFFSRQCIQEKIFEKTSFHHFRKKLVAPEFQLK